MDQGKLRCCGPLVRLHLMQAQWPGQNSCALAMCRNGSYRTNTASDRRAVLHLQIRTQALACQDALARAEQPPLPRANLRPLRRAIAARASGAGLDLAANILLLDEPTAGLDQPGAAGNFTNSLMHCAAIRAARFDDLLVHVVMAASDPGDLPQRPCLLPAHARTRFFRA